MAAPSLEEQVLKAARQLSSDDPLGQGVELVQKHQPELWRRYRRDYA